MTHEHHGRACHLNGCDTDQVPVDCPACEQVIGHAPKGGMAQPSATWDKLQAHLAEGCDLVTGRFASGGVIPPGHTMVAVGREQVLTPEGRVECRTIWETSDESGVDQAAGVANARAETNQPGGNSGGVEEVPIATWYCTHPGEREAPAGDGPLPEAERCIHPECKPVDPRLALDAAPLDEQDFAELRTENGRLRAECEWMADRLTERRGEMKLELEDIRRLDIKPGEILVARVPYDRCDLDEFLKIKDALVKQLPEGVRVLVTTDNVDFSVLNPLDLARPTQDTPAE